MNETAKGTQMREKSPKSRHPDVNRVMIAGKLLHDPPLRHTRKGIPVTNFIVVTQPEPQPQKIEGLEREPVYVSVVVWAKQAQECAKHLRKGSAVVIMGELQSMPNARPEEHFCPVQISAQWIQYLEKGSFYRIAGSENGESREEEQIQENEAEAQ
ncbi:MAG: single-stranded DNA-binding protein [candidate division KSB1 bacterium]|nr:single-stranded DNA-binding protein [candidate division KSB1 bacterium]MDZ7346196.1 single-stranded DNA-binding protein [candidate division KSB1 bacterium]